MKRAILAVLSAALLVPGCGWQSDGAARLEELYPSPPPTPPPATCAAREKQDGEPTGRQIDVGDASCMGLLQGRWAVRLVQRGSIAPLGEDWDFNLTDLFIAELSEDKSALELRFCEQVTSIITGSGAIELGETRVPAKLKKVLHDRPVRLPIVDGGLAAKDVVWLWGLGALADPLNDPLPKAPQKPGDPVDSRVRDDDGDGHPGVTMFIVSPEGERYMVRRAIWELGKSRLSEDSVWIQGELGFTIHEEALDANNPLLKMVAPITSGEDCNKYELRCVGPSYGCEELAADFLDLFAGAPK
ncbi:MAG TPA: hypothetical protein DFS52_13555 [Myxococcales bacterium]|nr:hypothetical protein [Myxococcales bacterium]